MKADTSHGCPLVASGFSFSPRMTAGGPCVEGLHMCPHPHLLCSAGDRTGLGPGPACLSFPLPAQGVPSTSSPAIDSAPSELKDSLSQSFLSTTPLPSGPLAPSPQSRGVGLCWECTSRSPHTGPACPPLWVTGRLTVSPGVEFPRPSSVGIREAKREGPFWKVLVSLSVL